MIETKGGAMKYDAMSNEGVTSNPMTNDELFWKHMHGCDVCNQHPQSVASFYYEPMCTIGRSYAEAMGMFKVVT